MYYLHYRNGSYAVNGQWAATAAPFHCSDDAFVELQKRQAKAARIRSFLEVAGALLVLALISVRWE